VLHRFSLAALALAVAFTAVPAAAAEDDLVRQLVNACTGCRFPKDLHGRDLHGLHFTGADLRGVDFTRANLNGAVFIGADLADARFDDADLRNVRFTGVRFRNTSFARANTAGVEMEGVRLDARSIVGADYRTFLRGCTGCDLRDMKLSAGELRLRSALIDPPAMPADMERSLRDMRIVERELRAHPPVIPPDVMRRLHALALHPPRFSPEAERALRRLREHPPVIPPMPAMPVMPPMPAIPPLPPLPAPAPPAERG